MNVLLHILDLSKNTNIASRYSFYSKTLNWSRDELLAYQNKKLLELLLYAQKNTPYYKNILCGLDFNNKNLMSLFKEIPILTRNDIQNNEFNLISKTHAIEKLNKGSSSGTTGTPLTHYTDKQGISSGTAAAYVLANVRMGTWAKECSYLGQSNINKKMANKIVKIKKLHHKQ